MYSLSKIPPQNYLPATLRKSKELYYIDYYAINPVTNQLKRVRIKLKRQQKKFPIKKDFIIYANKIVSEINIKLTSGWSPFFNTENSRLYTPIGDVTKIFITAKKRELRENTIRSYSSFCNMFIEWCNNNYSGIYCGSFKRLDAVRYMDYFYNERKVSNRTFNNHLKLANTFFQFAIEKCYIIENPFLGIKRKLETEKKRILIDVESRKKILSSLNNDPFKYVLMLIFHSLIRPGEIKKLQYKDINFEKSYIVVNGAIAKNHKTRYSAVESETMEYFKTLHCPPNYYIFGACCVPSQSMISDKVFFKHWDKLRKKIKLPAEMQLYSLRDSGITEKLQNGLDPLTVMKAAGHHDLAITTRYASHSDNELINKINKYSPEF